MTKKPQDLVYELTNEEIQRLFVASDNDDEENKIKLEELKRKHFTYKELMFFADKLDDVLIETTQTDFDDALYQDQIQNARCALEVLAILQNVYKRTINDEQGGVTPPKGQIHFKTSKAMSGVNFFEHDANDNYDFSFLEVYINDELTNIPANALTANAGDDIKIVSRSKPYPFFYPSNKDYIASIEEPLPFMGVTDFSNYFYLCSSLISIPAGLFDNNTKVTDFSCCFSSCSKLAAIPTGLFDKNTNVTNFYSCFWDCASLTSIPAGLFDNNTNVTDFSCCFYNCNSLTSIPVGLFDNNTNVTDFSYCFRECTSLTSIPQGLFDKNLNVTDFGYCFYYCRALTSIPAGLFDNNTKVADFSYCFGDCTKLKVNVQIGSTTTESVYVTNFANGTAAKGTVYCRAGSNAYNAFLADTSANVNALTY